MGDVGALPVKNGSTNSADHCSVAVNDRGDIFVLWDEQVNATCNTSATTTTVTVTENVTQSVGIFIPTRLDGSVRKWEIPAASELLGDPCKGDDGYPSRCQEGRVVSVDRNFILVYPRKETTGGAINTQLEAIGVEVHVNTTGYDTATFHYPGNSSGEGYDIGSSYDTGDSGGNTGLCWFTAGELPDIDGALAVILHEPGASYVYDLYAIYIDYTVGGIDDAPDEIQFDDGTHAYLITGITSEDNGSHPEELGIAPFVIQDDNGYLVLAYEEWESGSPASGWIRVKSYSYDDSTDNLELADTEDFYGSDTSWHHRRPVLGMTPLDSPDSLGLSWTNYDEAVSTGSDSIIDWREIVVDGDTGAISQIGDYEPALGDMAEHGRAIFAYDGSAALEALLYRDKSTAPDSIWYLPEGVNSSEAVRVDEATSADNTDRPAYAVWNDADENYLIVVWDQEDGSDRERPFIKIIDISE